MKVKYLGPMSAVRVGDYGKHEQGEVKDYPPDFAKQLVATSKRQQFKLIVETAAPSSKETKHDKKK